MNHAYRSSLSGRRSETNTTRPTNTNKASTLSTLDAGPKLRSLRGVAIMGSSDQIVDGRSSSLIKPKTFLLATLHWILVFVHCTQGDVRLVGGGSNLEGRLEISYENEWGTVCDDLFDDVNARVVCSSLGLGYVGQFVGNRFGPGSGRIWLDNVRCRGSESSINACRHNQWGVNDCQHGEDVSVSCYNDTDSTFTITRTTTTPSTTTIASSAYVRLAGSGLSYAGRLEVYHNGIWGTVCDDGFGDVDARVACYSLGFGYNGQMLYNQYGAGTGQIWLDNVYCNGTETFIGDCSHNGWSSHNCDHSEDVSISCIAGGTTVPPTSTPTGPCGYQFTCDNGDCIRYPYRCNGYRDCDDGSDEEGCYCDIRYYFQCDSGSCISRCNVCDGYRTCGDGSDERGCPCQSSQFSCDNGGCVSLSAKCNGIWECSDGSDEVACNCDASQFKCSVSETQCIEGCKRCDGIFDCADSSDEFDCECPESSFRCSNGQCISACMQCDHHYDCIDFSDEVNCTYCDSGDFRCASGNQCVPPCARCDGVYDCRDHSDEFECNCTDAQFRCRNGQCIPYVRKCDQIVHCHDGTDELGCPCLSTQFTCVSEGYCIPQAWHCDDYCDCVDCSDDLGCPSVRLAGSGFSREGRLEILHRGVWGTVCSNSFDDIDAKVACYSLGFGYVGWSLNNQYGSAYGQIWLDNVHCFGYETFISHCQHRGWGVHQCSNYQDVSIACYNDTERPSHPVQNTTVPSLSNVMFVALPNYQHIYQVNMTNGYVRTLLSYTYPYYYPLALAYDQRTESLFFSDYNYDTINRYSLVTNTTTKLYNDTSGSGMSYVTGLTFDSSHQKLYYADYGMGIIGEISVDGSGRRILFASNGSRPHSIVVDSLNSMIYWTDSGSIPGIYQSPTVNRFKTAVISTNISSPTGLTIDFIDRVMYWADISIYCRIESANLDGSRRIVLYSYYSYCNYFGLAHDATYLYITDNTYYSSVKRLHRTTLAVTYVSSQQSFYYPAGIVVLSPPRVSSMAVCSSYEFRCNSSSTCIPLGWRCDNACDCPDCSDERNCYTSCSSTQFTCVTTGSCISYSWHCDNYCDCAGCTDEFKCNCTSSQFKCASNGRCVSSYYRCDGSCYCDDCSDEFNCTCTALQYRCPGAIGRCLPGYQECDGIIQCPGGEDESNCANRCVWRQPTCDNGWCLLTKPQCYDYSYSPYYFRCNSTVRFWCDGYTDCPDGSDESNCNYTYSTRPGVTITTAPSPQQRCSGPSEYRCANGWCISVTTPCSAPWCQSYNFHCDGYRDCPDGSDEANCTVSYVPVCRPGEFQCRDNKTCIRRQRYCDGFFNCPDGSDEMDCPCPYSYQWKCHSGECIYSWRKCDGTADCSDGSDEICDCSESQFRCVSGQCTTVSSRCEGISYCKDNSDQVNCSCGYNEFQCGNYACISKCRRCDGQSDCTDGSDEFNCTCNPLTQFRCHSGECLKKCKRCDGNLDCRDFSDEMNCTCPTSSFQCATVGLCIPACQECDGIPQCPDNSDEVNCSSNDNRNIWTRARCGLSKYSDAGDFYLPRPLIVGGTTARAYEFPWQVSLWRTYSMSHFCGGAIISERFILTAAHCVYGESAYSILVVVGEYQRGASSTIRQTFSVRSITYHQQYNPSTKENDIAVIQINGSISFTENIRPVCAPIPDETYVGRKCQVSGWGYLYSGSGSLPTYLQYTTMNVTTRSYCVRSLPMFTIVDGMFCTTDNTGGYSRDSCQGDSGGPLTVKEVDGTFRLIGLVSFGQGCAYGYPGVNTQVSHYLSWITNAIRDRPFGNDDTRYRLNGSGLLYAGRLEVYHNGVWGTVCRNTFGDIEARVACYSLGFGYIGRSLGTRYGAGAGPIWLASVDCSGHETSIDKCAHYSWGNYYCYHYDDVSISCLASSSLEESPPEKIAGSTTTLPTRSTLTTSTTTTAPIYSRYSTSPNFMTTRSSYAPGNTTWPWVTASTTSGPNCYSGQFQCANGNCISRNNVCSYSCDCSDCSDESNCCYSGYFQCSSGGGCVSVSSVCTATCACSDCSDERSCYCTNSQFRCSNGICVSQYSRCDGYCNCGDCSDEYNCSCSSTQFTCVSNGRCISLYNQCDGSCDCSDCSDEIRNCTCNSLQFTCASNGRCIPSYNRCNTQCDCLDCSDEDNCNCTSRQFKCVYSGRCISSYYQCDGYCNCEDCSDESNCSCTDLPYQQRCRNGRCFLPSEQCDGVNNCGDYTDEINCSCPSYYYWRFQCRMGVCLPYDSYCNGIIECPDGSDEPVNCNVCGRNMFSCDNGRCISMYSRCDGMNDCGDYSDEISCTCSADKYKCNMGLCVSQTTWCDGYKDCPDGSDELPGCNGTCPPTSDHTRLCKATGKCIFSPQICDHHQDCVDDSDEINCPCDESFQYPCINGRCIYKEWLCDGVKDCPLGDDELQSNCSYCRQGDQFQCSKDTTCLNLTQVCDGVAQCSDSSDEAQCLSLSNTSSLLSVTYEGRSGYYVCSNYWNASYSDAVCHQLGYPSAATTTYVNMNTSSMISKMYLQLQSGADVSGNLLLSLRKSVCSSKLAVALSCNQKACGQRAFNITEVGPYIINGQWAARGAWPWQVMIIYNGRFNCGGSLLNSRWVLTAAHCTRDDYNYPYRASLFMLKLGTIQATNNDTATLYSRVDFVLAHPDYDPYAIDNDVALLRLASPVTFTDTIRPICLPDTDVDLDQFKVCVDTGFGRTSAYDPPSSRLLQVRMNIMSSDVCSSTGIYSHVNFTTMLCIGSYPTYDMGVCYGDSGGPLACKDQHDTWTVIGVNSWGINYCAQSVVARVPTFADWLRQTMNNNS